MRFKHSESHRTFSNCILTEIARYMEFFYMSSGWFDWTEPSLTTSLQGRELVQGALCTGSGSFKHIEPHRTFSSYIFTEISRYREFFYTRSEFFYMSSGWFEPQRTFSNYILGHSEPHRTFSTYILTEIAQSYAPVRGGSSTSNLIEPSRSTSSQREEGI